MIVIEVANAGLTYRVLKNRSGSLKTFFKDIFRSSMRVQNYIALENIKFKVKSGEILVILGGNGAGKSTLLKLLAGVLPPTHGSVLVHGSIAPMIELGAGFHPELTGAENVLFYSTLMGREIKQTKLRIDEIGAWAGVSDHMDFPLRTYSSGMIARLAFATATDQNVDVLLIDEVLSVGDVDFQLKSLNRIKELIKEGSAVVLVTHDLTLAKNIAKKAIWLENGRVRLSGSVKKVVAAYEKQ
jgi:ABC-type polysaccharide/polyol phosphate transport system ATPase subunit